MPLPMPLFVSGDAYGSGSQPSAASSAANAGFSASTRAAVSGMRRDLAARLVDERANLRGVDEVAEGGVGLVLAEIAHAGI